MIKNIANFHKNNAWLLGSREFWFCYISGWGCFSYVNSLRAYYYGGSFYEAIINTLQAGFFASIALLLFRFYYFKFGWNKLNPLALVPIICLQALLFAVFISCFTFLVTAGIDVNYFFYEVFIAPNSDPWLGQLIGYFITHFYVILVLLLIYVFIQSERNFVTGKPTTQHILLAIISLLLIHEFLHFISTVAYYNPPGYLFSRYYFWNFVANTIFGFILSLYVFFIKPRQQLAGSGFLPQLPMFIVLVFCSSVFSMWLFIIIPYLYELFTTVPLNNIQDFIHYAYNRKIPLWGTADEFSGLFQSKFNEQITAAVFLLYCNFSRVWTKKIELKDSFDIKRALHFWAYNISGWSVAALYLYFSDLLELETAGKSISQVFIFSFIIIGAFLSALLRSFVRRIQATNTSLISFTYKIAALSLLFGILQSFALTMATYIYIYGVLGEQSLLHIQHIFNDNYYFYKSLTWFSLCFIVWSLIYDASISQRNKLLNALKQLQLENNMKKIQLDSLAGKIDPHFIFNVLNNIRSLIREDSEKARAAVLILSDMLRSPIAKTDHEKIPIMEEILLVRNYIALSKLQLEHRLNYKETLSEDVEAALIPPMMLQILVENAIKHGISQLPGGGDLNVNIDTENQTLICRVSNHGKLSHKSTAPGFGIGIENIKERIALLYTDKAQFILTENQEMVLAELRLPLEYHENKENKL